MGSLTYLRWLLNLGVVIGQSLSSGSAGQAVLAGVDLELGGACLLGRPAGTITAQVLLVTFVQ